MLASLHGNRVGALLLTTGGVATLPPRSGHLHLMALLHRPHAPRADGTGPDLSAALGRLAWPPARPGLVVVVSDFPAAGTWVPACGWWRPATRRWRWRSSIRGAGPGGRGCWWSIRDRRAARVATGDAGLRRHYAALARERRAATAATLRGVGVDHLVLRTDRDATADLVGYVWGAPPGWPGCAGTVASRGRGGLVMRFLVVWRLSLLVGVGPWRARGRRWPPSAASTSASAVELLDVVAPNSPRWRRHVPAVLFLVALAALVLGFARPVRAMRTTEERATVVLAVDVSLSMEATDVAPNRLAVAQEAARAFVEGLPDDLDVGLVTFHDVAGVAAAGRDQARCSTPSTYSAWARAPPSARPS